MRRELARAGFDEMPGPLEQHSAPATWGVRSRRVHMNGDAELFEAVEPAAVWPDVNVESDDPGWLASDDRRYSV